MRCDRQNINVFAPSTTTYEFNVMINFSTKSQRHQGVLALALVASLVWSGLSDASEKSNTLLEFSASQASTSSSVISAQLGRGVNLGGILEAPYEGAWGLRLQSSFFRKIKQAGFDHIRLPISWTYHADRTAPYTIDPVFFRRIDFAIRQARSRGLKIIINNHHYDELNANPNAERQRAIAIWRQIASRYRNQPASVLFEVLNEPHGVFNNNPGLWNRFFRDTLRVVRRTNPTRKVLVGPVFWNDIGSLDSLELPDDSNLIVSVHNYAPFEFTHQGASWIQPIPAIGERWNGRRVDHLEWQNWSWDTNVVSSNRGMRVNYRSATAGYYFHNPNGVDRPLALFFSADKAMSLNIEVSNTAGHSKKIPFQTRNGRRNYRIPMTEFDRPSSINFVMIQNAETDLQPTWNNTFMYVRTRDGHNSQIVATQRQLIESWIDRAARWAEEKQLPLHLGEFGVYDRANYTDRVRWTAAVRRAAERRNIDWSYWEFAFNFGIYNPETGRFRTALLKALTP